MRLISFLLQLYTLGIVVFLVLFLIFVPDIPFATAVISALLWPYGVYQHFIAAGI